MSFAQSVTSEIAYLPAGVGDVTTDPPQVFDYRKPQNERGSLGVEIRDTVISDARVVDGLGLDSSGFELIEHKSLVSDFLDNDEVMRVYYEECRQLAKELTGASFTYTYDHLIREPGRQISGGGTDGQSRITGEESGGGYIGFAHMDYTENTTWTDYLGVHNVTPPQSPNRIISLNFWRGLSPTVDDYPLAVCDGRTVKSTDLYETHVFGYGASSYSWHDVGIETYSVKYSQDHRWYYYPLMMPDEVLVIKAFDSQGVVGAACPHCAFLNPSVSADATPRRSIELRVLCFVTD